jgi:methylphosphotriester-DNA--protein-cysteine methyltransferase
MTCPSCHGRGQAFMFSTHADGRCSAGYQDCLRCKGKGQVPEEQRAWIEDGARMRDARIAAGRSLRQEAARLGITAVELSEIERGMRSAGVVSRG